MWGFSKQPVAGLFSAAHYIYSLQVLEDGQLTDSQGRTVSFKNCLVIMTSNIGSSVIAKGGSSLGFEMPTEDGDGGKYENIRSLVMEEIKARPLVISLLWNNHHFSSLLPVPDQAKFSSQNYFRPEMLNRLDEIVVFHQLTREQIRKIADMVLAETAGRLQERGISLQVTEAAMDRILEQGFDEAYGARPLRRAVTMLVDDALSDLLLNGSAQVMSPSTTPIPARPDVPCA